MSDDSERLPVAVAEEVMVVFGVELKVVVLDDGRRVIEAAGMERLLAMFDGTTAEDDK